MNFIKKNIPVARGMQPTKWDKLLPEFVEPGDSLMFDESDVSRISASQAAKRLMILDPSRKFHSFFNVVEKKVVIRVRPQGEVPDKDDSEDEAPKQETFAERLARHNELEEEQERITRQAVDTHVEEQVEANFDLD